ncbi:hypothetical protein kpv79_72 [Klebsiella phage vB_KpnM_KpV79]|uniref:Uncharacterized protein n=1 Tax=Klebsiella phage vB_KpnM_KpV79 TaxID=2041212 RepID=A0A291LBT8_9CAUD|nr:hypothetical protein FDI70_gp72 [Klebsiella phage vB_KpnM_KpV79]ATI16525.1 hypothetical protein kpv79_72 [Klebsiella phage vB_KpnM_KpV79]
MSILTDEQLLTDVTAGMSGHAIAKKYGMSPGNITVALNVSACAVWVTVAMCLALCRTVTR